jgi:hypothetical protein
MFEIDQVFDALLSQAALGLPQNPLTEFLKLAAAAAIGMLVTKVRRHQHGRPLPLPLEHAMILLTLAGALMMIIIGNSLPRALGIAGVATIVRFRTPVDDPRDTTLFLILLGLGMTCGIGLIGVAGLSSLFVCGLLLVLNRMGQNGPRHLELEVVANCTSFPTSRVESVLSASGVEFELHEMSVDTEAQAKYLVTVRHNVELKQVSDELMLNVQPTLRSVSWSEKKWMRQ